MYIRNNKTGVIQECINADVISHCNRDPNYSVAETPEELNAEGVCMTPSPQAATQDAPKETQDATDKETDEEDEKSETDTPHEASEGASDYASMKINDLRRVAKEKGIQGYMNMGKDTLIEVIKALS